MPQFKLWLFLTLISVSMSFAQTHPGGGVGGGGGDFKEPIPLSSLPIDRVNEYESDLKELLNADPDPQNPSEALARKMAFIEVNYLIKSLIKQVQANVKKDCHVRKYKIRGLVDILTFNANQMLSSLAQGKAITRTCDPAHVNCHLRGSATVTLRLLTESKSFVDYMVEKRGWEIEQALQIQKDLKTLLNQGGS